jgi:hypothetical protein
VDHFTDWTLAIVGLSEIAERWPEAFRKAVATAVGMVAASLITWLAVGSYGFASTVYSNDNEIAVIRSDFDEHKEKAKARCERIRNSMKQNRERLSEIATQIEVTHAILLRLERNSRPGGRTKEGGKQ